MSRITMSLENNFEGRVLASFDLDEFANKVRADAINAIKNVVHARLLEEMNDPYQDQSLCQGLHYAIHICDWYLNDDKEQKNE